jgi:hypothetical protein
MASAARDGKSRGAALSRTPKPWKSVDFSLTRFLFPLVSGVKGGR